jgi:hypothetical protein
LKDQPDVPDRRPSPMHGSSVMPRLISAAGRCMFATSAEPEKPIGPVPPRAAQNDVEEEHLEHLPEIKELFHPK